MRCGDRQMIYIRSPLARRLPPLLPPRRTGRGLQSEPSFRCTPPRSNQPLYAAAGGGEDSFGAGHLFDEMAEKLGNMGKKKSAVSGGEDDRLSALPEDVIRHLLSFLPSRQAVRTCVLATRWRNLWKSVPSIRIDMFWDKPRDSVNFINSLLRYRERTPLDEFDIVSDDEFHQDFESWLRYAVSCKVRDLSIQLAGLDYLQLSAGTLFSEHLTRLNLDSVGLQDFFLHVSSCQSLEELEMRCCEINMGNTGTDFPKSLRLLRIITTTIYPDGTRSSISAPGLVTLELDDCDHSWTPVLKSLPSLVTAFVNITISCFDSYVYNFCRDCGGESDEGCYGTDNVLLKGLSGATNLELISHRSMLTLFNHLVSDVSCTILKLMIKINIFRKEMRWCHIFSKLKTLLLDDWCMTPNFSGLVYFLQNSPVLEILTLQFFFEKNETSEVYKPKEQFLVSKHLKAVEITYSERDGRVQQILNLLAYHGVHPELINIEKKHYVSCFSFQRDQW